MASWIIVAAIGFALGARNSWTIATLAFGGYAAWVTLAEMWRPVAQRMKSGESIIDATTQAQWKRGRRRFGSYVIHAGAVIVIIAIAVSSTMRTTHEVSLHKGGSATIKNYSLQFLGTEIRNEPNRVSTIARFRVRKNGRDLGTLEPRMNQYAMMREPIGTPAVHSTITEDLYVSIMNVDPSTESAGVLLITTPMVGWIWYAVLLMGLGGVIALVPPRRIVILSEAKDLAEGRDDAVAMNA